MTDIETTSARDAMVAEFEAGGATLAEQMAAVEYAALVCTTRKPILDAAHATLARVPEMEAEIERLREVTDDMVRRFWQTFYEDHPRYGWRRLPADSYAALVEKTRAALTAALANRDGG